MKKLILLVAFAFCVISASAQSFIYEIAGDVSVFCCGQWKKAYKTMSLSPEDSIRTDQYSSVVILDRSCDRVYSFQSSQATTLRDLIARHKPKTRRILAEVTQGLLNALFSNNNKSSFAYEGVSGVSYRGEDEDRIVAAALAAGQASSVSITFRILSRESMSQLDVVCVGEDAIVEVTNNTDVPLYFNIIDTDSEGNITPILPFDELRTMLHLYLPPMSIVRFEDYPIGFYEPCGVDRLTLVASTFPFDLQNVISMQPSVKPSVSSDVYIQRRNIKIVPAD